MSATKPTLVVRTVAPSLVVMRENIETPHDHEWDAFLALLNQNRDNFAKFRLLVVTDGGGPNAAQRKRLDGVLGGRSVRVAVVTESAKSRFIASAISLINRDHRGFSPAEIEAAYTHLALTPAERRLAEAALREMDPLIK
jgi:hypothetical protein